MTQWIQACAAEAIDNEGALRFDHGGRTYALYRSPADEYFCTDGLCTHEAIHLADGLVMDYTIECPKHSGEFDYRTGEAMRVPACKHIRSHATRVEAGRVFIAIAKG